MKNLHKIAAIASTIVLSSILGAPAYAMDQVTPERSSTTTELQIEPQVTVPADAEAPSFISNTPEYALKSERLEPAPVEVAPYVAPETVAIVPQTPEPAYQTYTQAPVAPAPVAAPAPTPAPAPDMAVAGGYGPALVGSAYAQIGTPQDCTAMVEKALRSIGKSVGDLAPAQFYQYGSVVPSPAAGDLVITPGHVAIYVGGGQVISGGLNGMNTGVHNLADLPGASFVRVM